MSANETDNKILVIAALPADLQTMARMALEAKNNALPLYYKFHVVSAFRTT